MLFELIFLAVYLYFVFFIMYWKWRLTLKLLDRYAPEWAADVRSHFKDLFRFACWLLGVKYKN